MLPSEIRMLVSPHLHLTSQKRHDGEIRLSTKLPSPDRQFEQTPRTVLSVNIKLLHNAVKPVSSLAVSK